jgi:hypothetical protein
VSEGLSTAGGRVAGRAVLSILTPGGELFGTVALVAGIGAVVLGVALPGLVDFSVMVDQRVCWLGTFHLYLNFTIVGVYVAAAAITWPPASQVSPQAFALHVAGLALVPASFAVGREFLRRYQPLPVPVQESQTVR